MTRTGKIVVTGVSAALLLGVLAGCSAPKEAPSAQETEKAVQVEKQTAGGESLFVIEDNAAARAFVEDFLNEDTYLGDGGCGQSDAGMCVCGVSAGYGSGRADSARRLY